MPATTQQAKPRMVRVDMIASQSDIARHFDIGLQAAWNWTHREDFPEPIGKVGNRLIWDLEQVIDWEKNWVRSKGGYHTHRGNQGRAQSNGQRKQWKEGDPE